MTILEHDVQILKSQVLADVPEGGGAATGVEIIDGVSNNLFPDISELDRVYGAVNLRKVFVGIRTADTDGYFGAHVIVSDPPDDPDVSCVLFNTESPFDTRVSAASRVESYLAQGSVYAGQLFGNHLTGQMTVTLIQRTNVALPAVGGTLDLRKNEGLSTLTEQYVRIIDVEASERTFADDQGEFVRLVVVLKISDQLQADFPGFEARRLDAALDYTGKTKVYDTVVADAARYYGIIDTTEIAHVGDFTAEVDGIFTQLVPSSRAETPIADARVNQRAAALVAGTTTPLVQTNVLLFTTTHPLYVGGGILPGSLTVVRSSTTVIDNGGKLESGGVSIGTVDYANGLLQLATDIFGTATDVMTITYTPVGTPTAVTESVGIPVTQMSQALTYVVSLEPIPARGSLQVSYLAQGRWNVLQDDGSGALRGSDPTLGAGTLNFSTGTVALTLGALPDVKSKIILSWAPKVVAPKTTPSNLVSSPKLSIPIDFPSALVPGSLALSWNDGAAKTAGDASNVLTGDATGTVMYGYGHVDFSPNNLPAPGTVLTVAANLATQHRDTVLAFTESGSNWLGTIGTNIKPKSLRVSVFGSFPNRQYPGSDYTAYQLVQLIDDGSGNLKGMGGVTLGTVNYTTGLLTIGKTASITTNQGVWETISPLGGGSDPKFIRYTGQADRAVTLTITNGAPGGDVIYPPWTWWSGSQTEAARAEYAGADGAPTSFTIVLDHFRILASLLPGHALSLGTAFSVGDKRYVLIEDGKVVFDVSTTTGAGTEAGTAVPTTGTITITNWQTPASPNVTKWAGVQAPPLSGADTTLLTDGVTFRTASAPLVSGGFSMQGTFADGTTFNVTANADGYINSSGVIGYVDYQTGVGEVRFGTPTSGTGAGILSVAYLGVPTITNATMKQAQADTIRYNAVAYSYLPLDSDILGLNPVRLPSDGRVPIFRTGTVAVIHHTAKTSPATVSNGQTVSVGRTRLARLRVIGADGVTIEAGFTRNLDAGTVTFTAVAGYSQPVRIEHRIEDVALVADAQISGLLRFNRPLTHDFPLGSYVSSALIIGNMAARVSSLYDQATWNTSSPVWSDDLVGSVAGGTFDQINYPPVVTNLSAVTERWALVFTGSTVFNIYGEHFGLIGAGSTGTDCQPLNPATGYPYFHLDFEGFGNGWAGGNVIRINTVGALAPFWWARVIKQGVTTVSNDSATVLVRGDIDTP